MRATVLMLGISVALIAGAAMPAAAGGGKLADEARVLIRDGRPLDAAAKFGEAAAAAHRAGDIAAEAEVAKVLDDVLSRVDVAQAGDAAPGTTAAKPTRASLIAAVLAKLDAKRAGAFVAAPALARNLLFEATESGERSQVKLARAVLEAHAKTGKGGAAAPVLARYAGALGVLDAPDGGVAKAIPLLREVVDASIAGQWPVLAVHAATECAAAQAASPDGTKAAAGTLRAVLGALPRDESTQVRLRLRSYVTLRVKDIPQDVIDLIWGGDSAAADGGAGGAGANAGERDPKSPYGRWIEKAPKTAVAVRAKLTRSGWEMRLAWAASDAGTKPVAPSPKHWSRDGVTLAFDGRAASVVQLDPTGMDGAPGENAESGPWAPLYFVAEGETWALLRDGTVTVTAR